MRSARADLRTVGIAVAFVALGAATFFPARDVRAIPVHSPSPPPTGIGVAGRARAVRSGSLLFTLESPISSTSSQRGEIVPARLAYSLVVGGITVARAGAPEQIEILNVRRASGGDIYGYVDIFFKPFQLSNGLHLPLIAPVQRLSVKSTLGHESTVGVEDTVSNILFPPHVLYEAFRKGRNIVLGTGTQLRARMTARLAVIGGAVVLVTPPPLPIAPDTPSAAFTPIPFITPPPAAMKHGAILHPSPPSTSMPTMSALH